MAYKKIIFVSAGMLMLLFTACNSNEIGNSRDVNQFSIYQHYQISYSDFEDNARITCQFRFAGKNGTTLVLNNFSQVEFDGVKLKVDSSFTGGAFYPHLIPIPKFYGRHDIRFTDTEGRKYENSFTIDSFRIIKVPENINRKMPLTLNFSSSEMGASDYLEVNSTDTDSSFTIRQQAPAKTIRIPLAEVKRQKVNTLNLECKLHREMPLQQGTAEGGVIIIEQQLKPVKIKIAG